MELQGYVRLIRKRALAIVLCTLFGLAAAIVPAQRLKPTYTSSVVLFAGTPAATLDAASANISFALIRLATYVNLVSTSGVTDGAQAELKSEGKGPIGGAVNGSTNLNTVLLTLTAVSDTSTHAQDLVRATADAFLVYVGKLDQRADGTPLVSLSIVRQATPGASSGTHKSEYLAAGLLGGLLLGLGLSILVETLDTTIRRADDVSALLTCPVLGILPRNERPRGVVQDLDVHSPYAEAFRQLRTNLQFIDVARKPRSLLLTSALPSEGKTTTVLHLALALAGSGLRILVVDADLRRSSVHRSTGLDVVPGLTDLLIDVCTVDEAIRSWKPGVDVLPCGQVPPNPSELLGSDTMVAVLGALEARYDLVLVDTPPLLPVADAAVLATLVSGAIAVVRVGRAKRDQVRRVASALEAVKAPLVGAIVNGVDTKGPDADFYGYYGHVPEKQSGRAPKRRERAEALPEKVLT